MEKISIIVTLEGENYQLTRCLKSILSQKYQNIEIIIVSRFEDNGIIHLVQSLGDSRIKVVFNSDQSPKYVGLLSANGSLITFVKSSDYLKVTYLSHLVHQMDLYHSDIAISGYQILSHDTEKQPNFTKLNGKYTVAQWLKISFEQQLDRFSWGKLYRKLMFDQIIFPLSSISDDDFTVWKTYLNAQSISFTNDQDYIYCLQQGDLSLQMQLQSTLAYLHALEERISFLNILGFEIDYFRSTYQKVIQACRQTALEVGDYNTYKQMLATEEIFAKRLVD